MKRIDNVDSNSQWKSLRFSAYITCRDSVPFAAMFPLSHCRFFLYFSNVHCTIIDRHPPICFYKVQRTCALGKNFTASGSAISKLLIWSLRTMARCHYYNLKTCQGLHVIVRILGGNSACGDGDTFMIPPKADSQIECRLQLLALNE